jgi:hydroxypyruvate isomerase
VFVVGHVGFRLKARIILSARRQTVIAMPKFAANLSFLFTEVPFPERFARAAAAGFAGVEYLFPYDWPAHDVAGWLAAAGVEQVLFNLPPGDWAAGERGLACLPHRQGEFAESVERALDYAIVLDCERVHCMAGLRPDGVDEAELETTYVANLRYAADRLATAGVTVTIEPINSRIDMPGYWLDDIGKAIRLLAAVDRSNVKLQLDLYHAQIIHGDLARTIEANLPHIAHVQVADNPGRHEPGTGEIHYPYLFALLDRLGYTGWVGCEYKPLGDTEAGLGWRPK